MTIPSPPHPASSKPEGLKKNFNQNGGITFLAPGAQVYPPWFEGEWETEVNFRGVQVDNCFSCGGMFLDQGEAEKLLAFEEPGTLDKMFQYLIGKD